MTLLDINRRARGLQLPILALWFAVALVAAPSIGNAATGESTVYLEDIADMPLAPGLTEDTNAGLVFDKPDGRIVDAVATGKVARDAVAAFYDGVLPELGWRRVRQGKVNGGTELIYDRDDEQITITIAGDRTRTTVHFEVSPK